MWWIENENYKWQSDRLRLDKWKLYDLKMSLQDKSLGAGHNNYKTKLEEDLLLLAVNNLIEAYERKDHYVRQKRLRNEELESSRQLSEQLLEVTEERDSLKEKIKEAQVASGLFIQSVRNKLGWEKNKERGND